MERPHQHESWCPYEYVECEPCTCDLEERQARWDCENRTPTAAELPRAVTVQPKRRRV